MKNSKITIDQLLDFQKFLLRLSEIDRFIYKPDTENHKNRRENNSEHSYDLAMTAWFLVDFFDDINLDKNKVIKYALIHDIVEIHAGDVMAIGRTSKQQSAKEIKEAEALAKIKKEMSNFPDLANYIKSYESQRDAESIYVKALDKILPLLLNLISKGKTWKIYDIQRNDVIKNREEKTKKSAHIYSLWQDLKDELMKHEEYFNKGKT